MFSLKLRWLLLCVLALCLNGANLVGYLRCRLGKVSPVQLTADLMARLFQRTRGQTN
jgi:hypothetical protein